MWMAHDVMLVKFATLLRMDWSEIPPPKRSAAEALGLTPKHWHRLQSRCLDYFRGTWAEEILDFNALRPEHMAAAEALGFDELIWAMVHREGIDNAEFFQLPQVLQQAAVVLGYDERAWDKDKGGQYEDSAWAQLSPQVQWAAKKLGYTPKLWDEEGDSSDDY